MTSESSPDWLSWLAGSRGLLAVWAWLVVALLYGAWRSVFRPRPDVVRPSGPTD